MSGSICADRELLRSKCPAPRLGRTGGTVLSGAGTSGSRTIWSDTHLTTARFLAVTPTPAARGRLSGASFNRVKRR